MLVYKAINAVQDELSRLGISKDRTCTQGASYKFRGIDDVYNTLSPLLAKHGLCILPRMIRRDCVERTSVQGKALFYVIIEAEFDFVCAEDGSTHTVRTFGEAMDSGDKATNKAMSAAYKYAAFQAFAIPTEGDNDADATAHTVTSSNQRTIGKAEANDIFESALAAIKNAASMEALKHHFDAARSLATNQKEMDALVMLKDLRKAEIMAHKQEDKP